MRFPIRNRLWLGVVLVVGLTTVMLTGIAIETSTSSMRAQTERQLEQQARDWASRVDDYFDDRIADLQQVVGRLSASDPRDRDAWLDDVAMRDRHFDRIRIAVAASSPPVIAGDGESVRIAVPATLNDGPACFVVAEIASAVIGSLLAGGRQVGSVRTPVVLVDRDRRVVAHAGSTLPSATTPSGAGSSLAELRASAVLPRYGAQLGWRVMTAMPDRVASASAAQLRNRLLIAGALVLALGLVGAALLAQTISRPLARLSRAAQRIGGGQWSCEMNIDRRDEIGELANAFNRMVGQLVLTDQRRRRSEAEQRTLEARLRQTQRLEAVGTLAAGIAHDFKNLLAILRSYTESARRRFRDDSIALGEIEMVELAAEHAEGLTQSLMCFSKQATSVKKPVELRSMLARVERLLRHLMPERLRITIEIDVDEELWLMMDTTQFQQVFMNLAINARDAMPDGGTFSIRVERANASEIEFTVADDGPGMPSSVRAHAFEPFVTSKKTGTGLGLAIVHGVVTSHDGSIELRSTASTGTKFCIRLPIVSAVPADEARSRRASRHVLLALPDAYTSGIVRQRLAGLECQSELVVDPAALLARLRHDKQPVWNLVIIDQALYGEDVADELRRQRPEPAVVVLMAASAGDDAADRDKVIVLTKPFSLDALSQVIEQHFDAGARVSSRGSS